MKKILSLVLIFVLSLTFAGITQEVKAAEGDATVYFHINQFDGDYTNTGIGIWDGVDWNDWGDKPSTNVLAPDSFGGVVEFVIPASKLLDGALMDEIQLEITKTVTAGDDAGKQAGLLAPGNGKVFADITSLKDGSATELHVYYVEGAEDVYVSEGLGAIFITYIDPKIASDETAYDGWNMWTWNNGTGGSDAGTEGLPFAMDMTVMSNDGVDTYSMPMKLVILEVGADADQDTGFIVRTADWAKQCGTDIMIDNSTVRGSGALMYYYHAESCDLETDGTQYLSDVTEMFKAGLKNKFVTGTAVSTPNTVDITMFTPKAPYTLMPERFMVKDADGNVLPITGMNIPGLSLGMYESDVVIQAQTHVVLFVETTEDHAQLGVVGNIQGWDPSAAITSLGDDMNGYAVFEFTTYETEAQFKVLVSGVDDPVTTEVDEGEFAWGDAELISANQVVDLSAGGTIEVYLNDADDTYEVRKLEAMDADIANYTYTSGVTCAVGENLFTLFLETNLDPMYMGMVGSIQETDWSPENAIAPTGVTTDGEVVFEVCMTDVNVEYKILYNTELMEDDPLTTEVDETVTFAWGNRELITSNVVVDFGEGTTDGELAHLINGPITTLGDYAPTLTAESTYLLSVYIVGEYDPAKLAIVGSLNGWDIGNPILPTKVDEFGNSIFDIALTSKTGDYIVLYDGSGNGFGWDDKASGSPDYHFDLGAGSNLIHAATINYDRMMELTVVGESVEDFNKVAMFTLEFAPNTFVWGEEYTVYYVEVEAVDYEDEEMEDIMEEVIMFELEFTSPLDFVGPSPVEGNGTYAVTPTEIQVGFGSQQMPLVNPMLSFDNSMWEAWYGDQWSGVTTSTVEIVNGELVVDVIYEGTPATYATQVFQEGFKVENGKFYRISFDAKAAEAKDLIVAFGNALPYDPWFTDFVAKTTFNLTTAMQTFTLEFEMTEPTTMSDGKLVFELATAINTMVTIDNVMIEEIDALAGTAVADTDQVMYGDFETSNYELVLRDENGAVVPFESYEYANMAGTYETDRRCHHDQELYLIHVGLTDTMPGMLSQLGVVGTINGWDIGNAIQASGMDSNGNYVFEVCLAETETGGEFKVKYDMDADGFTWDGTTDPEITPGNVVFSVANGPSFFVEEGSSALDVSMTHKIMLASGNALDKTKEYTLEFTDENGFVIYIPVDMDTQAPVVDYAVIPDVEFMVYTTDTFDLMDFFTKLQFLDNREGELAYEIVTDIDLTTPGAQTVTVKATDMWMNETTFDIDFMVVEEIVLPTITGDAAVTLQANTTEPTWADYVTVTGGTLTVNDSQVDMENNGVFYVIFTVENDNGDTATHTLEVTIEGGTDTTNLDTGCFSSIGFGSSIVIAIAALGGAVVIFVRKR